MRILVFQHLAVEHPGSLLEFWRDGGHTWVTVELDEGATIPSFEDFDALVVMGGPMDVWQEAELPWLAEEKTAIRRWVIDLRRPCLGICLGHQLLAEAVGGKVGPMTRAEVGLTPIALTAPGRADPLFAGVTSPVEVLQWHGAEVSALPSEAEVLAANEHSAIQSFRWGRLAYGFQFHVEATRKTIADWVDIPAYKTSLESALGPGGGERLDRAVAGKLDAMRRTARRINDNFFALL